MVGVSWGVQTVFIDRDKLLASDGGRVLGDTKDDALVGTRVAMQHVPLGASSAMSIERLSEVSSVRVSFVLPPPDL